MTSRPFVGTVEPPTPGERTRPGSRPTEHRATEPRALAGPRLAVHACAHPDTGAPRGESTTTDAVVAQVRALYDDLAARPDLVPGPTTNALFGRLVSLAIDRDAARHADAVLADPAVAGILAHLRRLCADGEFELERHWAQRVLARRDHGPDARAELARFPYHQNYRDLTRLEHHAVAGLTARPVRRVLFVGSGPLPLTSLVLAGQYGATVDDLDHDPEAVRLSTELLDAIGAPGLRVRLGDVRDERADDLAAYDLVYLAALAGLDPASKHDLLAHLGRTLRPGTLVLARSAHSLRRLLYPVLDPHDLPGLETLAVVHPHTDVVNSVVVARVTGGR